jgi:hypothetical protein
MSVVLDRGVGVRPLLSLASLGFSHFPIAIHVTFTPTNEVTARGMSGESFRDTRSSARSYSAQEIPPMLRPDIRAFFIALMGLGVLQMAATDAAAQLKPVTLMIEQPNCAAQPNAIRCCSQQRPFGKPIVASSLEDIEYTVRLTNSSNQRVVTYRLGFVSIYGLTACPDSILLSV